MNSFSKSPTSPPLQLDLYPNQPGVYLMKNQSGTVLYVGKAKNLRQRIKQYFVPGGDGRVQIPFLIPKVKSIDTIVVLSEKEALLLESNLIKQYQPQYNALLKDDKAYVALKVNNKNPWPRVQLVRYKGRPEADGLYFGPYTSAFAARTTLELIERLFPLRQCSDQEFARRTRPCILYDMKRCVAPCVQMCTREEYDHLVDRTVRFLKGQDKEILRELYEEMARYSQELEFERAGAVLRTIKQIEATLEGQLVDKPLGGDSDILGLYRQGEEAIVILLFIRNGKLLGSRHYNFSQIAEEDAELLISFIMQHYDKEHDLPRELIVPIPLPDAKALEEILSQNVKYSVSIHNPQRGDKKALIEMAYLNAEATYKKEKDLTAIKERTLFELQERLQLAHYPKRIECFDNSNLQGTDAVSVLVAFTEGEKEKKRYRKYKVRSVAGPDDYSTMYEVLSRRYKRAKEENDLPDLVIIDGGKGHLNVAIKVFAELDIITVDLIAVAKEQGRHDKGITSEQVFLPNVKDPILLKKNSPVLFLLQRIRDEAHRFAITFHRKSRSKKLLRTSLLDIPGIGPKKSMALLKHFGGVPQIMAATVEELTHVGGLSKANINAIVALQQKQREMGSELEV